ncbi:MAG: HNH endonuclease [Cyanobacteria bacterium J06560_2]
MSSFETLVRKLMRSTKQVDSKLQKLQEIATTIKAKYEPRPEFERWKQTLGGRKWKREQYRWQKGRCIVCQCSVDLKGSHIDHIQPLITHPHLAIEPSNLRILCADCNLSKGARTSTET